MPTANLISVDAFLPAVAEGQPVLSVLGLTPADFTPDSFEQLLENADDVGRGVTSVSRQAGTLFFGLFNQVVIKQHDDGGADYVFTGTTQSEAAITHLVQLLYKNFGQGYHDETRHLPFGNTGELARLAGNQWLLTSKTLLEAWTNKHATCSLRYSAVARHELLLSVHQKPEPAPDTAVRTKGTVADLLRFNLHEVLLQAELRKEVELRDGALHFVRYDFQLPEPELGVFDLLTVRLFGAERAFSPKVPVNLSLSCSQLPTFEAKLQIAEQLIRLYGADFIGQAELAPHEVEELRGQWWAGRLWHLSERHAPIPLGESGSGYTVSLSMYGVAEFELTIMGYNTLIDLFTVS